MADMAEEIERKFLLRDASWRAHAGPGAFYRQGYLAGSARSSIRVRVTPSGANLNIKSATLGIWRREYEYPIPLEEANEMLDHLCEGAIIEKERHLLDHAGHTWEVDVFHGPNAGLVVAEIELASADEPFERPDWLGDEVSDDPRYYNVSLVSHPYCEW